MNGKTAFVTGASAGIVGTTGGSFDPTGDLRIGPRFCVGSGRRDRRAPPPAARRRHRLARLDIAAHRRRAGTADTGLRGILCKSFSNLFKKSTAGCVGDGRTKSMVGRRVENMSRTGGANPAIPFACQRNLTMDSLPDRLNTVLAHRGGGGIQPRNCPVPRRCHWMAHPSRKGKRGIVASVNTRAGSANEQRSDWGGGDGHWGVRPIEPSRGIPDRHRGGGSSRRYRASGLARRSIGRRGGSKPARGAPAE